MSPNFEEIRSFRDNEVPEKVKSLTEEKQFMNVLSTVFPLVPKNVLKERFSNIKTVAEFQQEWDYPFLTGLEATKTKGVFLEEFERIDKSQSYLYISNHRDIILDSAFLCIKLMENGLDTVEIAIGDNLLIFPWIKDLVRLNKSFIVRRSLSMREMLESSKTLSAYIRHDITERHQSVWLAQREGRAKDSNDRTQESLLKMLSMSGSGSLIENFVELNICPLSISYEFDPCDYLKAKEFQEKRDNPEYKKSPKADLDSMAIGVMGYKGKLVYTIAGSISEGLREIGNTTRSKNEQLEKIAQLIDKEIHLNYKIYNNNKIAFDFLHGEKRFEKEYSLTDKLDFEQYLSLQIQKIDLENKDETFLRAKMLEMYANPLINKLKAKGEL